MGNGDLLGRLCGEYLHFLEPVRRAHLYRQKTAGRGRGGGGTLGRIAAKWLREVEAVIVEIEGQTHNSDSWAQAIACNSYYMIL